MDLHGFFDQATTTTAEIIDRFSEDHAELATPCAEWNARELVEHMFAVSGQAKTMAAGVDVASAGSTPDPIGDDIAASYRDSVTGVRRAFEDPSMLDRTLGTPMGPHSGRVVFTVTAVEHLIHGWDLATAIGTDIELDPVSIGYAFAAIEAMPRVVAQFREWGAWAPPPAVAPDAPPTEALLALLGRDTAPNQPTAIPSTA